MWTYMTCIPGAPGAPGRDGAKGDLGSPGKTGTQGPRGVDGKKGEKGDPGIQGSAGQKGQQGDKGDSGTASHKNWKECTWTSYHNTDSGQIFVSEQLRLVFLCLCEEKKIGINLKKGHQQMGWCKSASLKLYSCFPYDKFNSYEKSVFFFFLLLPFFIFQYRAVTL